MTDTYTEFFVWLEMEFWQASLVFFRVGGATILLPGLGENSIPVRIKLAIAIVLTIAVFPLSPAPPSNFGFMRLALVETTIGVLIAAVLRLFIFTLQTAGSIAANVTSLAQLFGAGGADQQPVLSHIFTLAGLTLLFVADVHLVFLMYLVNSYEILPIGLWPDPQSTFRFGVSRLAQSFDLAFQLALPFVIISLLYNVTLGVINRAMPQLMVALVGAPFITGASIVLLALCSPLMLSVWLKAVSGFLIVPLGVSP